MKLKAHIGNLLELLDEHGDVDVSFATAPDREVAIASTYLSDDKETLWFDLVGDDDEEN